MVVATANPLHQQFEKDLAITIVRWCDHDLPLIHATALKVARLDWRSEDLTKQRLLDITAVVSSDNMDGLSDLALRLAEVTICFDDAGVIWNLWEGDVKSY